MCNRILTTAYNNIYINVTKNKKSNSVQNKRTKDYSFFYVFESTSFDPLYL